MKKHIFVIEHAGYQFIYDFKKMIHSYYCNNELCGDMEFFIQKNRLYFYSICEANECTEGHKEAILAYKNGRKMTKRIKFKETAPNILESIYVYEAENGAKYEIVIDKNVMKYKIRNTVSGRIYTNQKMWTNFNVLLRNLREHLEDLGVKFEKEEHRKAD